jgi:hypothetical protein
MLLSILIGVVVVLCMNICIAISEKDITVTKFILKLTVTLCLYAISMCIYIYVIR